MEKIVFAASLPDILSAISIAGVDGNSRIKLDIPANNTDEIFELFALRGCTFKVTIEKIENSESDW